MTPSFEHLYRAFEDRFRGSSELIQTRLSTYHPLLQRIAGTAGAPRRAIDLGCGRGEWLDLAAEAGLEPVGVDLNTGMAEAAIARGHPVVIADAMDFMRAEAAGSAAIISAFHLAEHLLVDDLLGLLLECHRVLAPGGLLIIETPNPENLTVGSLTFHIDPTHMKPLPPVLLEFLVQQAGFGQTAILRLNGDPVDAAAGGLEQAVQAMLATGRDYACLARKAGAGDAEDMLADFVRSASQQNPAEIGRLVGAAREVDADLAALKAEGAGQIAAVLDALERAHARALRQRDDLIARQRSEIERLSQQLADTTAMAGRIAELEAALADARDMAARRSLAHDRVAGQVSQQASEIAALRSSNSWRITAPMRALSRAVRMRG